MKKSQKNIREKHRVVAFVTVVIFGICAGFCGYIIWRGQKEITAKISVSEKNIRQVVKIQEKNISDKYKNSIERFLNTKDSSTRVRILKAFERRDREELFQLSEPYFKLFKKKDASFSTFDWLLPDNRAFLRIVKPKIFDDDVSVIRPDIVKANQDLQQNSGYMPARTGLSYRVVQPVVYQGRHLGVVQFGLTDSFLIDMLQEQFDNVVIQVMPANTLQRSKISKLPSYNNGSFIAQSYDLDLIKSASPAIDWKLDHQRTVIQGKDYVISKAIELSNYAGDPEGWLFTLIDISELTAEQRTDVIKIVTISIILLFFAVFIISKSYNKLIDKISRMNDTLTQRNITLDDRVTERTRINTALTAEIEERKQAENALKEEKFFTESALNSIVDIFYLFDLNGKFLTWNRAFSEVSGYSDQELSSMKPTDFFLGDDIQGIAEIVEKIYKEGTGKIEANFVLKDGRQILCEFVGSRLEDSQGNVIGFTGIGRDITERKQAEEKLAAEKERLAVTLRSIGDGVITTDIEGRIVFINKVAEQLTGWSNKDAEGRFSHEVFNIVNEKTGQKCANPVSRVLEFGRIVGLANHTALICKDGALRSIADSGAPIRDMESKIIGVVIVFHDITHEKKMEEELLKVRKLESVGVLAGGIAHDFNNILAAILGNIELAAYRVGEDTKIASLLSNAQKATKRAAKLTQQLLTFSKGGDPVKETTSVSKLISESVDFVLHGSPVSCDYTFPDDLWMVNVDSGQLGQVVQNIVINAKHAMPEGGRIHIRCDNVEDAASEALLSLQEGDFIRITIQDTGIGIPQEMIDKVFDPYFTTKQAGSGLGLAICHSIINKHDGHISVQSSPGKGTTFTIYLPVDPSVDIPVAKQRKPGSAVKAARIMVMDDDEIIRTLVQAQLYVLGHETILVADGEQAINKYQELQDGGTPVDLVIMDLTIPGGMGGQEAAQQLLQIDPDAKIIVSSGYSNDPVLASYQEYGFCAAIAKPFDLAELMKSIESTLS